MKITIMQIFAIFFSAFTLFLGNRELQHKKNEVTIQPYQCNVNIDSFKNVISEKKKQINKELESSISILQDSEAFVVQCVVGKSVDSDSNCVRVFGSNY